ncbi:hypothetical protein FRB99_009033 [Tulasnella sp. 403]|nr:hypothetical protein FRB99_009033 [Tulasnella sp. 403]
MAAPPRRPGYSAAVAHIPPSLHAPSQVFAHNPSPTSLLSRQHSVLASLRRNQLAAAALDDSVDLSLDLCFDDTSLLPYSNGGYSDVYRATLPRGSGGIQVAIKVLRPTDLSQTNLSEYSIKRRVAQRMVREMRVWKRLEHRRILPLLGYAMLDVLQVGEGLEFLHRSHPPIVHSDLKANNILISDAGDAMLSDFGLSRLLEAGPSGLSTSHTGVGALRWRAPELLAANAEPTTQYVVLSNCLAPLLNITPETLEIMTGNVPFKKHESDIAVIRAKLAEEEIVPSEYPELHQANPIWPVLAKCWTRNPTLRPIASDMLGELRELVRESKRFITKLY